MEQKFNEAQQELVDRFKEKLKKVSEETLSNLYTDVCNYAASDAHVNYHQYLQDEFQKVIFSRVTEEGGHYSWAHSIRMRLLHDYPDKLRSKIIVDLEERIKSLEQHIEDMRKYR